MARIFAKALNCRNAPTEEPCNRCDQCRAITAGNAVDVVEIDGASNRGIDDVRRLKEVVGYAPMEGAFKIFIIDEAHMLSREAFNALLKTLEEPPARVTFIMATTEPHKFPATIISRCQHYVFRRLPEKSLAEHLRLVLDREGVEYDEGAVQLIARRGAGSVRDSMSLLGQVLALREGRLSAEAARSVLGLVGQEAFLRMLDTFRDGDALSLSRMLREMLDQGLDMGFFLRELSSLWRNLFMLRQSGASALNVVDLPEDEAKACLEASSGFSLQHIHASWQMTLDGQRRVLTSLEPALALELLLLNIAMLPRLLSLENVSALARRSGQGGTPGAQGGERPGGSSGGSPKGAPGGMRESQGPTTAAEASQSESRDDPAPMIESAAPPASVTAQSQVVVAAHDVQQPDCGCAPVPVGEGRHSPLPEDAPLPDDEGRKAHPDEEDEDEEDVAAIHEAYAELAAFAQATAPAPFDTAAQGSAAHASPEPLPDWESIFRFCAELETPPWLSSLLRKVDAGEEKGVLVLTAEDSFVAERLLHTEARQHLDSVLEAWCGRVPTVRVQASAEGRKTREELREEVLEHPLVKEVETRFGAYVVDYGQLR